MVPGVSLPAKPVLPFSPAGWHEGFPGTSQGDAVVSPFKRAAQTAFVLSVGKWRMTLGLAY